MSVSIMNSVSGGGGGISSDEVTAIAKDVVKGKTYLGNDTNDEIGTGTLTFANYYDSFGNLANAPKLYVSNNGSISSVSLNPGQSVYTTYITKNGQRLSPTLKLNGSTENLPLTKTDKGRLLKYKNETGNYIAYNLNNNSGEHFVYFLDY